MSVPVPEDGAVQKKVCMAGAFGAGKTSLVRRFVEGIFHERYRSGWAIFETSAKTGAGVEDLFAALAAKMLQHSRDRTPDGI